MIMRLSGLLVLVVAGACSYEVTLNTPGADTTGGNDSTFVPAVLTVVARATGSDSALLERFGSPGGAFRDAAITVHRQGSTAPLLSDTTDADGHATFRDLLPGAYVVSVVRLLSAQEIGQLDPADADVNAFGGATTIDVQVPTTEGEVGVFAGRRGSLVISEVFTPTPRGVPNQWNEYNFGQFIEVYNNADTVVYLDGVVIARGHDYFRDYSGANSCDSTELLRMDPDGTWSLAFNAFPGSGTTYPLAPGAAVVVATDAVDHRHVLPGFIDLTNADFEFHGSNDVENPSVPNMLDVGFHEWVATIGHGLFFQGGIYVLISPVDTSLIPRATIHGYRYGRLPRDRMLDVFTTSRTPAGEAQLNAQGFPLCERITHPNVDRQHAALYERERIMAIRRRLLVRLPDGRAILLRTRSSVTDFELANPTPRIVP